MREINARIRSLTKKDYAVLTVFVTGHQLIAYILGVLTRNQIDSWYNLLDKPFLTPPDIVFAIAWTFLYLLISLSGWLLYLNRANEDIRGASKIFILQLLVNWSWTLIFFVFHFILAGAIWTLGLVILVGWTIARCWSVSKAASLLLVPYFLWIIFAFYLNFMIWLLN